MHHNKLNLTFTPKEREIFKALLTYRQQLHLKTVLRVAGGWVRDKILGKESNDIDIALDDMKGQQFVNLIKKHAQSKNQKVSGFGVTKFNPELSKHLQTATVKLFDQFIDFVNLRSEKYNQDSRIPIIDIGTPKEDAQRRDFTINSLFYNIITEQVEDWTERGIDDLQKGIIRTPLQPWVTFKDDPLRILRCFRFAGRFNFKVVPQIIEAIQNKQIRQSLKLKVSKQRLGIQLSGMLNSNNPLSALQYIFKYNYWNIVFQLPKDTDLTNEQLIESIPSYSFNCLQYFIQSINKNKFITENQLIEQNQNNKQKKKKKITYQRQQLKLMMNLSCLMVVYKGFKKINPKNTENLVQYIVKSQIKYSAKVAKFCVAVCESICYYENISDLKDIINIIRWLKLSQQKWQMILHVIEAIKHVEGKIKIQPMQLRQLIFDQKLQNSYLVESYIDGNFLTKRGKKGAIIKTILDNSIIWKILNPHKTKEQFLEYFQENSVSFQNQKLYS